MNKRIGLVIAGVAAASVLAGGAAYGAVSSIPDAATGVIHGCYDSGGNVKVIDTSVTTTCPKGYTALNWNQKGPAGAGATVTPLTLGNSICPSGGAEIQDGNSPAGTAYACSGTNGVNGTNGINGTNGTSAAPEFTWTIACPSGDCAGNIATSSIPDGVVLTPVSITVNAGTCPVQGLVMSATISDAAGIALASVSWGASTTSGIRGPDPISAVNGNVGPLRYVADAECVSPFTISFNFDETQAYN
jgi:hypothetical protein